MRAVRKHAKSVAAIVGLMAIALAIGLYIAQQQRLRIPLVDDEPFRLNVALSSANAVTPGQGQTVQVAGVKIGRIGDVDLRDGRAIVGLDIQPRFDDLIHTDARALLRPRTGLKDMYIQVFPGSADAPLAREGFTIPVANTLTDVDLHDILGELDQRTRDYVRLLAHGTGRGLRGNGTELAEVFERFAPTVRDLARVNRAVAAERRSLRRAITSLASLNGRLAQRPDDLAELVDTSAATFGAFASEDARLRDTVAALPGTLRQATTTLRALRPFARELRPTAARLIPVFRALEDANREVQPFAREATPILRERIRPFARAARPLVADLRPAARTLSKTFPEARRSATVANRFFNMLAFNPDGREPAAKPNREEGFLFWLAWLGHLGVHLQNVEDANGPMRPVFLTGNCGTLTSIALGQPELEFGLNLSPVLASVCGNPDTPSIHVDQALASLPPVLRKAARK
jgi:phospholipid/cholesterol/gamma-HCH transport system substrate-binding protein